MTKVEEFMASYGTYAAMVSFLLMVLQSLAAPIPAFLIKPENSLEAILEECEEMVKFIDYYVKCVDGRFATENLKEKVHIYTKVTCLRGITWCAMAWVEYQSPDRFIRNEDTFQKLGQYIDEAFLHMIDKKWLS